MRTIKTCCCCGDKSCKNTEFKYGSIQATCKVCALGRTSIQLPNDPEISAPTDPEPNQGDEPWDGSDTVENGHPNNLHVGNLCWHNGTEGWVNYPTEECGEWDTCWNNYEGDGGFGLVRPPEASFYEFDSPMGLLPWSPQSFKDWIDNWNGPLLPQGDCSMHCTEENIGCHTLAFVGAIGKDYGSQDDGDEMPLCGSDIVTVPPPQDEWEWVRQWVQSGGKLIIMGESSGSPMEGVLCSSKTGFFSADSTYYLNRCEDELINPESMSGLEVAENLKEFAEYCAWRPEDEEPDEFFQFRDDEYFIEEREENFINNFEAYVDEDGGENPALVKSCCQRTKLPFLKRQSEEEPSQAFSFHCSSSSGLIPKSHGKALVGHCNGEGCTVVWKQNGAGAVVVVYDSNVWGVSASQVPLSWWEQEAEHPEYQELDATTLKERSCNSDFWKFMCEDFLTEEGYVPSDCTQDIYWDNMDPLNYTSDNPCLKTAACCLPDGSCKDNMTVWECFGYEEEGRALPGIWHGSSTIHPSGKGNDRCLSCGEVSCGILPSGVCCVKEPLGNYCANRSIDVSNCCLSENWFGNNTMYEYECCHIKNELDDIDETKWLDGETNCDECFIMGACCTGVGDECQFIRKIDCETIGGTFIGEDEQCTPNPCADPEGACCYSGGCTDEITEDACLDNFGNWLGVGSTCDECDEVGACCFSDESCTNLTDEDCNNSGGDFQGDGTSCGSVSCEIVQACCKNTPSETCQSCEDLLPSICENENGVSQGTGTFCTDDTCDVSECDEVGACCPRTIDAGGCECSEITAEECTSEIYGPNVEFTPGTSCEDAPPCCGACCSGESDDWACLGESFGDGCVIPEWLCTVLEGESFTPCDDCSCHGECNSLVQINCEELGICCEDGDCYNVNSEEECNGYYIQGKRCEGEEDNFCSLGACCLPDETCQDDTIYTECIEDLGGIGWEDGVLCVDINCQTGACCFYNGTCEDMAENECIIAESVFRGIGTFCEEYCICSCSYDDGPWSDPDNEDGDVCGACCLPDGGGCFGTEWTQSDCSTYTFGAGEWVICESCPDYGCPVLGACCRCGICAGNMSSDACDLLDGTYMGDSSNCNGVNCDVIPYYGACCFYNGNCVSNIFPHECEDLGGIFMGCNSSCYSGICSGQCCINDLCLYNSNLDCDNSGGVWGGTNSDCSGNACWGSCCYRDWECCSTGFHGCYCNNDGYNTCTSSEGIWKLYTDCWNMNIPSLQSLCGAPCPAGPLVPPDCPQDCLDAGCECYCLNTRDGIVCL